MFDIISCIFIKRRYQFCKCVILSQLIVVITVCFANALSVSDDYYKEMMKKGERAIARRIYFKLPLKQPEFHWYFNKKNELLSGSLTLYIEGKNSKYKIVVFQSGSFSEGWAPITSDCKKEDKINESIYFGFISSKKYMTTSEDKIRIELKVLKNLHGIGAFQQGFLRPGTYSSKCSFLIFNEDSTGENEPIAYIDFYDEQWELNITKDKGWYTQDKGVTH